MDHTPEAEALMRLPVPNRDGWIRMKVRVSPDGVGLADDTRWLTLTFDQFAKIQNVLDNLV